MAVWGFNQRETAVGVKAMYEAMRRRGESLRGQSRRRRIGGGGGSVSVKPGLITGVLGVSHSAVYSAASIDGSVTVENQEPLIRYFGTELLIEAAEVGDYCLLIRDNENGADVWKLLIVGEIPDTAVCEGAAGQGTALVGTTSASHQVRNSLTWNTTITLSATATAVTSGGQVRHGIELYTFPSGLVRVDCGAIVLTGSSPTVTNQLRVGLGTTLASGSGTTLLPAHCDVALQAITSALSSGGTAMERGFPISAVSGDADNCANLYGGLDSAATLYFNFCPTANWNASDDVTFSGKIYLTWMLAGVRDG